MRISDFGTLIVFEISLIVASLAALLMGGAWTRIVSRRCSGSHETISFLDERGLTRTSILRLSANLIRPSRHLAGGDGAQSSV